MGGEIRALLRRLDVECEKLIARCEDLTAQNAKLAQESADLCSSAGARKARSLGGAAPTVASVPSGGGAASTRLVGDWDKPWAAAEIRGRTTGQAGHFDEELSAMMGCLPSHQSARMSTSLSQAGRISAAFSPSRRISASICPAGRTDSQPNGVGVMGALRSRASLARADSGALGGQARASLRVGGPGLPLGAAERGYLDVVAEAQRQLAEEFAQLKAQLGDTTQLAASGATRVPKDTEELLTRSRTGLKGALDGATCSRLFPPGTDADGDDAGRLYYRDCHFPLLPVWESLAGNFQLLETRRSSEMRRKIVMGDVKAQVDKEVQGSCLGALIMSPVGWKRIIWNLLSMAMLSYDSLMLPMQLFDIQGDPIDAMEWASLCFWSGDVAMTFFTGVYCDGRIDMRFSSIARQYLQTWFIVDFLALAPDWLILTISAQRGATIGRLGKVLKTLRILRVLRLLRLLKFRGSFGWLMARISSEYTALCLNLIKILVCILMANHYLACFWFYISTHSSEPWVASVEQERGDDWGYFYVISYHWSISQLQGGMEVVAKTVLGRVYSIAVQLFALVATSMFISSATNVMTQLQRLHQETFRRQRQMIRYLRDNGVSVELATRIKRFVCGLKGVNREKTEEVELLEALPEDLRVALKSEVYRPAIQNHSLLDRLSLASDGLHKDLCDTAIRKTAHLPSEVIFVAPQECENMFFVRSGSFSYTPTFADELAEADEVADEEDDAGSTPTGFRTALRTALQAASGRKARRKDGRLVAQVGQCTCEMALWTMWLHRGDAVADGCLELYSVHVDEFATSFGRWKTEEVDIVVDYAKRYISWMNMEAASLLHDLSAPKVPLIS